jgi:hypothetical protein
LRSPRTGTTLRGQREVQLLEIIVTTTPDSHRNHRSKNWNEQEHGEACNVRLLQTLRVVKLSIV